MIVVVVVVVECYCILIYIIVEPCRPLPPDCLAELCLKLVLRTRIVSPKSGRFVVGPLSFDKLLFEGSLHIDDRTRESLTAKM